jgi:hypothetical protein
LPLTYLGAFWANDGQPFGNPGKVRVADNPVVDGDKTVSRQPNHEEMCKIRSVDDFGAFRLEVFEAIPHLLQLLDRMPLPLRYLPNDTQRIAGAV